MSAITKPSIVGGEYEKLPKIGAGGTTMTTTTSVSKPTIDSSSNKNVSQDCVVPFIENNSKSKMKMMIIFPL